MVRCRDGSLYSGWTLDVPRRVARHNQGTGAKYTRSRRPVRLVYVQRCSSKRAALRREHSIKRLSRLEKIKLTR